MTTWVAQFWEIAAGLAWRGSLVTAGYLGVRALCGRRIPAQWLFVGWLVVALRLVLPFGVAAKWSPFNWTATPPEPLALVGAGPVAVVHSAVPTPSLVPPAARPPAQRLPVREALGLAWLGGALMFWTSRRIVAGRQFRRWRRAAQPTANWVCALVSDECGAAGLVRQPQVRTSPGVPVPAISGLVKPTLWLPAGLAEHLGAGALRQVVRHELAHWRRRDLWAMELLALARALHWWNPLVWLAVRTARADCEVACDEFVMQRSASAEPAAYGASLLKVLGAAGGRTGTPAALGVFETRNQLKRRIQMIANYRAPSMGRTLIGAALVAAVVAIAATRELRAGDVSPASGITAAAPVGWWKNGNAVEKYTVGVDSTVGDPAPPSAYVCSSAGTEQTFGGMMQTCDAKAFRGKRVRLSGRLKTQDVAEGACLWVRIDGADGKKLAFDNMQDRAVTGTRDWTPAAVVLDVPPDAATLNFGFFLQASGRAWVSGLAFDEVAADVATTSQTPELPDKPTNLGFDLALRK